MSTYYAYLPYGKCTDCGSDKLAQFSSDVTCTHCGLEQGMGNFVADTHTIMHSEPMYEHRKQTNIPHEIFNIFALNVPVHDNIIDSAKEMYTKFTAQRNVSNEYCRASIIMGCIYYASRMYTPIDRRDLLAALPQILDKDFTKARNIIKDRLGHCNEYKNIFFSQGAYDITHDLNKIFSKLKMFTNDVINDLRRTAYKLVQIIKITDDLATLPQKTFATTIIYMCTRKNKVTGFTLKTFASETNVTSTTILKTEEKIKASIKRVS